MSVLTDLFSNIAAAIREKDGTTEPIPAANFPARIGAIPAGSGLAKSELSITLSAATGLSPTLYVNKVSVMPMTIEWGDGTSTTNSTQATSIPITHTYANYGNYVITLEDTTTYGFGGGTNATPIFGTGTYKNALTACVIGERVPTIGAYSFQGCSGLTSITIPNSIITIGTYAFSGCSSLVSITIPSGVMSIGTYAFYDCTGLTEINLNAMLLPDLNGNNHIFYRGGVSGTGITVNVGASVTKIPTYLFCPSSAMYVPKLTTVNFASGSVCASIGTYAFGSNKLLTSITIPDSVTTIGPYAFYACTGLTSVTIPNGVTTIGAYSFEGCSSLVSITIPNSIITIGTSAFRECSSLVSITIPSGVTTIETATFLTCTNILKYVFTRETPPTLVATNAFMNINASCKIYVPDASVTAYKTATNWVTYASYIYAVSSMPA
jgi:hypothetical protein